MAAVPKSQENYDNVDQLFLASSIILFKIAIAADLKLANILVSIMSHNSLYPCTYCYAKKVELNICSQLKLPKYVLLYHEKWLNK